MASELQFGCAMPDSSRRCSGFTAIELLIVVAVIGIISAIAIPNLLNAIDRGKQKRTMADMRTISQAIASYSVDNNFYPAASDVATLAGLLEPIYSRKTSRHDGWGNQYVFTGTAVEYTLGSCGKGGGSTLTLEGAGGGTNSISADIIAWNGIFIQWPEGMQE